MTEQQELERLRMENPALRKLIKRQSVKIQRQGEEMKHLATALDAALCALREANGMVGDDYMKRRDAERKLAGLQHMNLTCAALGIQPVFTEN